MILVRRVPIHSVVAHVCRAAVLVAPTAISAVAFAQTPGTSTDSDAQPLALVTVTGTRVAKQGYDAPTPTTVVDLQHLEELAPANVADAVNMLPQLAGSTTPLTENAAGSLNLGMNLLNLRNLGPNRTLVLLDGSRFVPSNATLNVDINLLPTELIKRIDVVTGGASADWGSDAVAGVVNFVLEKKFTGFKGFAQGSMSEYGDAKSLEAGLTYGAGFASDRGHFELSAKYMSQGAVYGPGVTGRSWYNGWKVLGNPALPGTDVMLPNVGLSGATDGGLITSGPLRGTQFIGAAGTPAPFNFGFVSGPESAFGSAEDDGGRLQLQEPQQEGNVFARLSYDIGPRATAYLEMTYADSSLLSQSVPYNRINNITINSGNPFLPASVQAAMTADGIESFVMGKINQELGYQYYHEDTDVYNAKAGMEGELGETWSWNVYYQRGRNNESAVVTNDGYTAHYNAAVDAVDDPATGEIVCRSTLSQPGNGCLPFDPFGTQPPSAAVQNYITGTAWEHLAITQDDASAVLRGNLFATWAGAVAVATGLEYRRESYTANTDPLSQVNAFFGSFGTPSSGAYDVKEAFVEAVLPVAKNLPLMRELDMNGAVRYADYSESGSAVPWKAGITYQMTDDVRLRAVRSRDIRAPNLQDLFATGILNYNLLSDPATHTSYQVPQVTSGNRGLSPEVATTESGGIVVQPHFAPGLSVSADYFKITIGNAINTPPAQGILNQCAAGNAGACALITRGAAGEISLLNISPLNVQSESTSGIDLAASYQFRLGSIVPSLPGTVTLSASATDTMDHTVSLLGSTVQYAGTNGDGALADPRWRGLVSLSYRAGRMTSMLASRFIGRGIITNRLPVIVNNGVPSVFYFDWSASWRLTDYLQVYGVIDNMFNRPPPPSPMVTTTPHINIGANDYVYDTIGRQFRLGVRLQY